jgi:hypothetical protein
VVGDSLADHGEFFTWQFAHCNQEPKEAAIIVGWRATGELNS